MVNPKATLAELVDQELVGGMPLEGLCSAIHAHRVSDEQDLAVLVKTMQQCGVRLATAARLCAKRITRFCEASSIEEALRRFETSHNLQVVTRGQGPNRVVCVLGKDGKPVQVDNSGVRAGRSGVRERRSRGTRHRKL